MKPDFNKIPKAVLDKLHKLGLKQPLDLVLHLPLRYEDETHLYTIADALAGSPVLVEGEVMHAEVTYKPRKQLVARIEDASGELYVRLLNFYPNQQQVLAVGRRVRLLGEIRRGFFGEEMVHPKIRVVGDSTALAEALTPVYPTVNGLSQPTLRKFIAQALEGQVLVDTLPATLLRDLGLMGFGQAVQLLHHPTPDIPTRALSERMHPAWLRIKFDELLAQQLSMRLSYQRRHEQTAPVLKAKGQLAQQLIASLPFGLTGAQSKVLAEIRHDLGSPHPMQRLLQGDVGAGKTIVAALAALDAIEAGYQVALMAPTEILAEQHYKKLSSWLAPLGIEVAWLAGSLRPKAKAAAITQVESGSAQLAVGTHALFQDSVAFTRLGLAIVDEQHRFGVHQRLALRGKGGSPHQLMMSATPIPRTLAMSYYADLDVSIIDELPPGRTPIKTRLVSDARREEMIEVVRKVCSEGRQAYWVCPLIEESEALELQTAEDTHAALSEALAEYAVGLVHGRLKSAEKAEIMAAFSRNEIQVLVATTVIEVGVDVPNATLMVIEHAERMGLAQLHQLRGRVGRGALESSCVLLFASPVGEVAKQRLKVIFETTDGFVIAREDLRIRGPGEFLGARQSGVPMLRFADLERDTDLLERARDVATDLLARAPQVAEAHLQRWLAGREELLKT
ncbi:ATP-dependent DNA helicase RecG [Chitinimonas sp. BJB300]|uniref:ATP-dependent DNA helicase RecG n=1 Tax=Chitinimonas sp. BJB300 TaxID=1559339 RepID=UPI000C0FE69F|nr:ATP-dependent DNA helicase RecG [Chitinimonas sp. BJB300]PHV10709.1 ATP-dependent DNA helicase RecG [Chitinimonas sp. BJB300]TSJ89780.1 ATP-dependent DNA helicase RecG [Chitinimonas sp. BJB300]